MPRLDCFTPPPSSITCQITDKKGSDLLNPSATVHFDTSKIKAFLVLNGQKTLLNHRFSTSQTPIQLTIEFTSFLSETVDNQINIQLDSSNTEVLKCAIQRVRSKCCTYFEFTKKSINDKEVDKKALFSIVK